MTKKEEVALRAAKEWFLAQNAWRRAGEDRPVTDCVSCGVRLHESMEKFLRAAEDAWGRAEFYDGIWG